MQEEDMRRILAQVASGALNPEAALEQCRLAPVEDILHGLTLDSHRQLRTGLGEVVFAQGKSDAQLVSALEKLAQHGPVLATRVSPEQDATLRARFAGGCSWPEARLFSLGQPLPNAAHADEHSQPGQTWPTEGDVLVLSAGAADRPVALECFGALHFWGLQAGFIPDVGVAGLHRLQPHLRALAAARILIAVAGMEGALPGVVAGFVRCPVLAVPTSVGYGVGAGGLAALSTMLCTCVPGVAVVNIDNGFGAAAFAAKYLSR